MARFGNAPAVMGSPEEEQQPRGLLAGLGQPGGLLAGLGAQPGLPRVRNWLGDRSSALMGFGIPLLLGGPRKQATALAMQGLQSGQQTDAYRRKEKTEERLRLQREQALATVLASLEAEGKLPPGSAQSLAGVQELGIAAATQAMKPPEPIDYGFTEVDGTLIRTNSRDGSAQPVYAPPGGVRSRPPQVVELFDEQTGRPYKATWNPQTQTFDRVGGTRAPSGPLVTNTITSEGAEGKLREKLFGAEGEQWGTYRTAGGVAGSLSRDLDSLEALIGMAPDGPIAGALAQTFPGFSSAGDAFNSVVSRAAPQMRVPGSGATSDIEYEGMLRSFPRLINSEEGKRAILAIMRAKVDLDLKRSEIVSDYQNGRISDEEARQKLDELNRVSVVPPGLKEALGIGTGAGDDAPVTGKPPPPDRPAPPGWEEEWEWMTPEERDAIQ